MSILIQILRIHGLIVLEQENNLLITKVRSVSQLATVISSDLPEPKTFSPIVTRIFRIRNGNLPTVASVVKPMLSDSALLEISPETRQIIITDITTNVDKISALLASIDAPHSSLEIDSYTVQNTDLDLLIKLTTEIISPFAEGNFFTLVPQKDSSTIFIISTPYLIERTVAILEDLDTPKAESLKLVARGQTAFLYQSIHKSPAEIVKNLVELGKQLRKMGASESLILCLDEARLIQDANAILFLSNDETLKKIKEILEVLDTVSDFKPPVLEKSKIYFYRIQNITEEELQNNLDLVVEDLQRALQPDSNLINTLMSVKYLSDAHSLIFTGDAFSLAKLEELLPFLDTRGTGSASQFFIYTPSKIAQEQLKEAVEEIAESLKLSELSDSRLLQTMSSMKVVPLTRSLIFTGTSETLTRVKSMLELLDKTISEEDLQKGQTFFLYKLQKASGATVVENLKKIASKLSPSASFSQELIQTLSKAEWIQESNSILIEGAPQSVDQTRTLIQEFDVPPHADKSSFFVYKPIYQKATSIELALHDLRKDLEASGLSDQDLLSTLDHTRCIETTNSLIFSGTPDSLEKVKLLIDEIDTISTEQVKIQHLGKISFLLYKVQHAGPRLLPMVKAFVADLSSRGVVDREVVESVNHLKWIESIHSVLATGPVGTIKQVEPILKKFDTEPPLSSVEPIGNPDFIIYTPKYQSGEDLISILGEFHENLAAAGVINKPLFDVINHLKWMPQTHSLIVSGDKVSVDKINELLQRFDVPKSEGSKNLASIELIHNTSFLIYKLQNHQGSEILQALKQIAVDVGGSSVVKDQNLSQAISSLQWIQVTNSLLASGEPNTLSKLRTLIQSLDAPLRQVFIEILVIDTSLANTQNFGLQWGGKMKFLNKFAAGTGNFPLASSNSATSNPISQNLTASSIQNAITNTTATSFPTPNGTNGIPFLNGWDLGVIGDIIMHKGKSFISLGSLVNALQSDIDSTIVLNPKVITQDNRTTTIFVGNNIPYIGSLVTTNSSVVSSSSNIEYRDIGFNLTLTPTIGNNDVIVLDINTDISEVVSQPQIGSVSSTNNQQSTITGIQTSHTSMTTRVHLPNKHFVVLSGMITDTKTRFKTGIPCLGGLPVVGFIFSENDRLNSKRNIIIFLRPELVHTYEEFQTLTERQEDVFKENTIIPILKEEFDAAIDMVKTPEGG